MDSGTKHSVTDKNEVVETSAVVGWMRTSERVGRAPKHVKTWAMYLSSPFFFIEPLPFKISPLIVSSFYFRSIFTVTVGGQQGSRATGRSAELATSTTTGTSTVVRVSRRICEATVGSGVAQSNGHDVMAKMSKWQMLHILCVYSKHHISAHCFPCLILFVFTGALG